MIKNLQKKLEEYKEMITDLISRLFPKNYKLEQVFTPSKTAVLTFVKRPEVEKQIERALLIPGMQVVLYGHSGSGKTTIIQNTLQEKKIRFITTHCILDTSIDELILDAFDKLNAFYISESTSKETVSIGYDLKASYLGIESTLKSQIAKEDTDKKIRALPIQLTPQRLTDFLGVAQVIWIIEDFHKVKFEERQKFSQILKIFVDSSNRYEKLKVVAIGAVGTARQILNYDSELNNRISEIHVPLMNESEIKGIISKGERYLNIDIPSSIDEDIVKFSNSLAAICHHLCFSMCLNNKVIETQKIKKTFNKEMFKEAVFDYLKQNSDSFKEILDRALKHRDGNLDNTRPVLLAFCKSSKDELTKKEVFTYNDNRKIYTHNSNVSAYLQLLITSEYGEILRYDDNSGKYSFSNPFFKAYALMHFETEESNIDEDKFIPDNERVRHLLRLVIEDMETRRDRSINLSI